MERTVKQKRRDEYNNTPSRGGGGHTHPGECTWAPTPPCHSTLTRRHARMVRVL